MTLTFQKNGNDMFKMRKYIFLHSFAANKIIKSRSCKNKKLKFKFKN